ncbi:SIR2 family protein [Cupriavidus gilardii]|uniref:SIR2 family protein n=1 Tax=Cupriavidus gilardii TaxID=82541 RepID=UPI0007E38029|nr:SIR2 family protein [Cupriavidus gilardii]
MSRDVDLFVRDFVKELREDNAAVFAGAGFSAPAGFVNWRDLLRPVADELHLDIEREHDLVAIAQYHFNENGGNRHRLNQLLIDQLTVGAGPTVNHQILARLPISTYWTTNYDQLIEQALREAGKTPDVKYTNEHLAVTRPRRDAVIYKMHGDVDHPNEAVLLKDDYENYHLKRGAYLNALSGDLVSKTFLFLGFSFTDPNLDYVLSRIRITFRENQRRHFCIFKRRVKLTDESDAEFEHAQVKQRLAIADLKRFNIKTLLIDDFPDITDILTRIERAYRARTILVSGSAAEYGEWSDAACETFLRDLSSALVQQGYRLVTGMGLGVGDAVITGAIGEVYRHRKGHLEDSLVMRPFPRANPDPAERARLWEAYRQELASQAGICLVVFGNKSEAGSIVPAGGVRREVEIAREKGLTVVPIGGTGYVAQEVWAEMQQALDKYFPEVTPELTAKFEGLGAKVGNPSELISRTLDFINFITRES